MDQKFNLKMFATSDAFDDVEQSLETLDTEERFTDYMKAAKTPAMLQYTQVQVLLAIAAALEDISETLSAMLERTNNE